MEGAPLMLSLSARKWLQLLLGTVGLAWLLAAVVAACYVHNVRWDLSTGNRFTLSDHAHLVLAKVNKPVKIRAFIRTEDPRNVPLKDLLWQVSHENPLISYDVVDVNRNPAMASEYGVSSYGSTVVESGGKRADFNQPDESLLMSALLRVMRDSKKVAVLDGHGECDVDYTDRQKGCSLMRNALSVEGYRVSKLSLAGGADVPADTDVVVVPGPQADFFEPEVAALERWLARGGRLAVFVDPFQAPRLVTMLAQHGIRVGANVVMDPENRLAGGEAWSAVVADTNRQNPVTATLKTPPMFSLMAAVVAHDDDAAGREASTLLRSGPRSWASHDPDAVRTGDARFVAGRDLNGPVPVGVAVLEKAAAASAPEAQARLLVFGDSDFVSNRFLDYLGNRDLLVNGVNWLAMEDDRFGARPAKQQPGKNQFFFREADADQVFRVAVLWQPGLFLLVGIAVSLRRRFGA